MTEAQLQRAIIERAAMLGYHVMHARPARTTKGYRTPIEGHVGFPDVVLARDGYVFAWEFKGPNGRASAEQLAWGRSLVGPHDLGLIRWAIVDPATYDLAIEQLDDVAAGRRWPA